MKEKNIEWKNLRLSEKLEVILATINLLGFIIALLLTIWDGRELKNIVIINLILGLFFMYKPYLIRR